MTNEESRVGSSYAGRNLQEQISAVKAAVGNRILSDDDILLLLADSIAHTVTYEEKGYQ